MSTCDLAGALADLRHHWSSAYMINKLGPDAWIAQRRDDYATLRAGSPDRLLLAIRADYTARPVPRRAGHRDVAP